MLTKEIHELGKQFITEHHLLPLILQTCGKNVTENDICLYILHECYCHGKIYLQYHRQNVGFPITQDEKLLLTNRYDKQFHVIFYFNHTLTKCVGIKIIDFTLVKKYWHYFIWNGSIRDNHGLVCYIENKYLERKGVLQYVKLSGDYYECIDKYDSVKARNIFYKAHNLNSHSFFQCQQCKKGSECVDDLHLKYLNQDQKYWYDPKQIQLICRLCQSKVVSK